MIDMFVTARISYFSLVTRTLAESTAKAILPAVAAVYILPTMLLFFPIGEAQARQAIVAGWHPAPVFAVIGTEILSRAIKWIDRRQSKTKTLSADERADLDLPTCVFFTQRWGAYRPVLI
ncbi:hypothetical protein BDV23DRAFT_101028 [Aspergillus alliaceus]|uniref:Uncharacterized protein n=1 Tax=Petromyces alliaceus TaxID=209559 RepID=A0A5N7C5K5_PETAA|nr:hypothetical protein BDV23DRAFT_101028 [Aspergillus alliaceus]